MRRDLIFLQEMLNKQHCSSTIKVDAAAIVAFQAPIAGRSVGRDSAVNQFSRGASQVSRRPEGPFHQPCLPGIRA